MADLNLHNITNSFLDVRLTSLASWRQANEIMPRDRGGPYVVLQEGYDPGDPKLIPDEFVLGRSGNWVSIGLFCQMPLAERRAEFVFGTAAEVMQMMDNLPSTVQVIRAGASAEGASASPEPDDMAAALQVAKAKPPGPAN